MHVACTNELTHYRIAKRGEVPDKKLGIVVHDHWKSYFTIKNAKHAICNVHLLRELKVIIEEDKEAWAGFYQQSNPGSISEGSCLQSDGSSSYNLVREHGYSRNAIAIWGDPKESERVLPWVHVLASNSKRFLLSTHHGIGKKYLARYLGEFIYRYNRRQWADQLFERLLCACLLAEPSPRDKLMFKTVPATSV